MDPSTPDLIDAIATALRQRIAPAVADQPWLASELRTVDALLALVRARVEHEAGILDADNTELVALLAELAAAGVPVVAPERTTDATPHAWNVALRTALEASMVHAHDGAHEAQVASVRRYLVDAARREQPLYTAMTSRRLF